MVAHVLQFLGTAKRCFAPFHHIDYFRCGYMPGDISEFFSTAGSLDKYDIGAGFHISLASFNRFIKA